MRKEREVASEKHTRLLNQILSRALILKPCIKFCIQGDVDSLISFSLCKEFALDEKPISANPITVGFAHG